MMSVVILTQRMYYDTELCRNGSDQQGAYCAPNPAELHAGVGSDQHCMVTSQRGKRAPEPYASANGRSPAPASQLSALLTSCHARLGSTVRRWEAVVEVCGELLEPFIRPCCGATRERWRPDPSDRPTSGVAVAGTHRARSGAIVACSSRLAIPPRWDVLRPQCDSRERHRLARLWARAGGALTTLRCILHFAPEKWGCDRCAAIRCSACPYHARAHTREFDMVHVSFSASSERMRCFARDPGKGGYHAKVRCANARHQ